MGRGCGWLRWALSESGFAGFEDFRDFCGRPMPV